MPVSEPEVASVPTAHFLKNSLTEANGRAYRLASIDMLRGLVIVVMAVDHVRDYFNFGGEADPMANPGIGALDHAFLRTRVRVPRGYKRRLDDVA
jgi:uncharacterized membrane protein